MDLSSMWLPELETEDIGLMSYNDTVDYNLSSTVDSFSSESYTQNELFLQTHHPLVAPSSATTFTISFGDDVKPEEVKIPQFNDPWIGYDNRKVQTNNMGRGPVQSQDHVLAERKRRQKLNRHFISMSALLPNLKKLDKATVLEDAANHIRKLQDRVKELEESNYGKDAKESVDVVIALKKSRLSGDHEDSYSKETGSADCSNLDVSSTEIEVRLSGNSVLIRILSGKNSSLLNKVLTVIHQIGLSVINSSAMPFANAATLIVILAQIEDDIVMTPTDIVRHLQQVL